MGAVGQEACTSGSALANDPPDTRQCDPFSTGLTRDVNGMLVPHLRERHDFSGFDLVMSYIFS